MSDAAEIAEVINIATPKLTEAVAMEIKKEAATSGRTLKAIAEERGYKVAAVSNMLTKVYQKKQTESMKRKDKKMGGIPSMTQLPVTEPTITVKEHKEIVNAEIDKVIRSAQLIASNISGEGAFTLGRFAELISDRKKNLE